MALRSVAHLDTLKVLPIEQSESADARGGKGNAGTSFLGTMVEITNPWSLYFS